MIDARYENPLGERHYYEIFPYDTFRDKQRQIIIDIIESMENGDTCTIIARNGIGKTIMALSAALSIKSEGVIILGRTHRQMRHFTEELNTIRKKRGYDVDYVELLGRSSYCINPSVKNLSRDLVDIACHRHRGKERCFYKNMGGYTEKIDIVSGSECNIKHADAVSLKLYGIRNKVCPYYLSRSLATRYNVVIGTYMYMDRAVRWAIGLPSVRNKIIIVDEAHNLPSLLEEKQKMVIDNKKIKELKTSMPVINSGILKTFLSRTDNFINSISSHLESEKYKKISYEMFMDEMNRANITISLLNDVKDSLAFIPKLPEYYDTIYAIGQILSFFRTFYEIDRYAFLGYVNRERQDGKNITKVGIQSLDISHVILDLINDGAKIIFMSGTLNYDMFRFRLGLDKVRSSVFEYTFGKRDVNVFIVPRGDNGVDLSTQYHLRNDDVFREYAEAFKKLVDYIPNGILFFFPSYQYKKDMIDYLHAWGYINEMKDKNGDKMPYLITESGKRIRIFDDDASDPQENNGNIGRFREYVESGNKRAALFSVFRSRASEGEDYKNIRGIFIVGIPFANIDDAGIKLKMNYYDRLKKGYGQSWYYSDAIDAVNQACGRGIRRKGDFCAIFLMDIRYTKGMFFNRLSKWIRDGVVNIGSIKGQLPSAITDKLQKFYRKHRST